MPGRPSEYWAYMFSRKLSFGSCGQAATSGKACEHDAAGGFRIGVRQASYGYHREPGSITVSLKNSAFS